MCHGVFDVVHPGHVRHLLYAKSKADLLIASITADHHITKGTHRPHVPQDLRAVNLAAFEMVDYVVIDKNAKPIENIRADPARLFRQGLRVHRKRACRPRPPRRPRSSQSYGGEIIFTPGDIVYSSSHLIDLAPPAITARKAPDRSWSATASRFDELRQTLDAMAGTPRPCRRRHHRRQLYALRHDRRPDQDADHERAVRAQGRLCRRRGDRRQAPRGGRRPR